MRRALLLAAILVSGTAARADWTPAPADTIYWNGPIYTADDAHPKVEAVAVSKGKVAFAGSHKYAEKYKGPNTKIVDLKGAALFPGFTDSHAHLRGIGERELTLNLEGSKSAAEVTQRLKAWIADHKGPVVGGGWIETGWPEGRFLNRSDIDAVSGDTPVLLRRADGHAVVANSAALKAAHVDETTPAPFGGQILKGPDGKLTGMLVDNAMQLLSAQRRPATGVDRLAAFKAAFRAEAAYGWTGIHSMSVDMADVPLLE